MAYIDDDGGRRGPSAAVVGSLIVVALIVLAAVVVVVAKVAGGDDEPTPRPTSSSTAASSSSKCGLPDGDQAVPTTPPQAKWELTGSFATPKSPALGPAREVAGVPVCFAHSPSGAVVAAVSYLGATTDPSIKNEDLIQNRVLLDEAGKRLLKDEDEATDAKYQLAGFSVGDSTRDRVTVNLAIRSSEGPNAGQLYSLTFTLTWSGGDWKIVVPSTGQPPTSAVSSLDGFMEWSGA